MSQDKELVEKILDSISILNSLDKKRIVTHEGQRLHPSEILLLMHLFHVQNTNVIAIAKKMDLTKGAISQTLSRLQKKGIISKEMYPEKKNELRVQFTEKGDLLMTLLNKSKKSLERKYMRYIKSLSESDKQVVSEFLDKMISIMDKH
jgi:DNA-binding MarR family transcriptional regulator